VVRWLATGGLRSGGYCVWRRVAGCGIRPCFWNKPAHRWRSTSEARKSTGPALPSTARAAGPPPSRSPWPSALSYSRWPGLFQKHGLGNSAVRDGFVIHECGCARQCSRVV